MTLKVKGAIIHPGGSHPGGRFFATVANVSRTAGPEYV